MTIRVIWDEKGADLYNLGGVFISTLDSVEKSHVAKAETTKKHRLGYKKQKAKKDLHLEKAMEQSTALQNAYEGQSYTVALVNSNGKGKDHQIASQLIQETDTEQEYELTEEDIISFNYNQS